MRLLIRSLPFLKSPLFSLILFCNIKEGSVHIRYTPSNSGFISQNMRNIYII
uniref:Uncharacterized protein n=1 Tax=virus sp. ctiha2 TaxID=2827299 RepID=A0A8S5RHR9_9VIRU|nr:MAG TPA: hypothetical protein [virus sp. ctiha2]